jgi:hypothetical protein
VSYFGLAEVRLPNRRNLRLWEFLPTFINKEYAVNNLKDFAFRLRTELNRTIPESVLRDTPSGFHVCGYNRDGISEFWFVTNIGGMNDFSYVNLQRQYTEPSSDFLGRDALKLGWDGVNLQSVEAAVCIYRNGDSRAHVSSWQRLDHRSEKYARLVKQYTEKWLSAFGSGTLTTAITPRMIQRYAIARKKDKCKIKGTPLANAPSTVRRR